MMAAGMVVVAHRSGGPLTDIVDTRETERTGYLACTAEEYANSILTVLRADRDKLTVLRERARWARGEGRPNEAIYTPMQFTGYRCAWYYFLVESGQTSQSITVVTFVSGFPRLIHACIAHLMSCVVMVRPVVLYIQRLCRYLLKADLCTLVCS